MEAVKIDQKAMHQEKEALKKLENVKKDHERRLQELMNNQKRNTLCGQLIGMCCVVVHFSTLFLILRILFTIFQCTNLFQLSLLLD